MYGVFRLCGFSIETPKVNEYFAESILFVHQRLQKSNLLQKTKNLITKFFASCILSSCQDSICESSIRILSAEHLAFTRTCSGIFLEWWWCRLPRGYYNIATRVANSLGSSNFLPVAFYAICHPVCMIDYHILYFPPLIALAKHCEPKCTRRPPAVCLKYS